MHTLVSCCSCRRRCLSLTAIDCCYSLVALQCYGSIQHLKSRFGSGFTAEMKLVIPTSMELAGVAARVAAANGNHEYVQAHDGARICGALGVAARASQLNESGTGAWGSTNVSCVMQGSGSGAVRCSLRCSLTAVLFAAYLLARLAGAGWALASAMGTTGGSTCSVQAFAEWWYEEEIVTALCSFMATNFPGADLTERQGSKLYFAVPRQVRTLACCFLTALPWMLLVVVCAPSLGIAVLYCSLPIYAAAVAVAAVSLSVCFCIPASARYRLQLVTVLCVSMCMRAAGQAAVDHVRGH
jgi:hypothetical protein